MIGQTSFIGRDKEILFIKRFIEDFERSYIICVGAPGGIGKTRLIKEIHTAYRSNVAGPFIISDIIDFDDQSFRIPQNLTRKISELVGLSSFKPYLKAEMDYKKLQKIGASPEQLKLEKLCVNKKFVESFNKVSSVKRIILFFDTTDHIEIGCDLCQDIYSKLPELKNFLILMAGRNAKSISKNLQKPGSNYAIKFIDLKPLPKNDSKLYLKMKQKEKFVFIEPELAEKLIILTEGRPILIDLAIEWRARGISLGWFIEQNVEEIKKITFTRKKTFISEFEKQLVNNINDIRHPLDQLVLLMSHVYPLNVEMANIILDETELKTLFDEARDCVFIKQLPDGFITLHDEMRRLVNTYVWDEVDPDKSRRSRYSEIASKYFKNSIISIDNLLDQLKERKVKDSSELNYYLKQETYEQQILMEKEKYLFHTLYANIDEGFNVFVELFDEATRKYRFLFRGRFLYLIKKYHFSELNPIQTFEVESSEVKHLLDTGSYIEAKELAIKLLKTYKIINEKRIDLLIQLGNIEVRLGNIDESIQNFKKAVDISQNIDEDTWLMKSKYALGGSYRIEGLLDLALKYYLEAFELSLEKKDEKLQAWILNDLALAYSQQSRHSTALDLCEQAKELWLSLQDKRGLGALYEGYGTVCGRAGNFEEALLYYNSALEIFLPNNDTEWLSKVYSGQGLVLRMENKLAEAEQALNKALNISLTRDKAQILHRLAHVYWKKNEIDKAKKYFEKSLQASKYSSEIRIEMNNINDLIDIAVNQKEYSRWNEFYEIFKNYKKRRPKVSFPDLEGRILKYLGDLALGCNPNNITLASGFYSQAFPLIAEYDSYKVYTVRPLLSKLDQYLESLHVSQKSRNELGRLLYKTWKVHGLLEKHPEALIYFYRWMKQKDNHEG